MLCIKKRGFTLVELIVVITILAILATIAFVSLQGYQKTARESTRISDVRLLEKKLSIYGVSNNQFPLPDNFVTITASGTTIGYQGDFGTGAFIALQQAGDIVDPLDGEYYSYFVDAGRQSTQILALMEKQASIDLAFLGEAYAIPDYTFRYPKVFGDPLGIMTKADNTPIHQTGGLVNLDIINYSGSDEYTAYFSDVDNISGTGGALQNIVQNANCKRVTQFEYKEDGIYTINPGLSGEFDVYCEKGIDGGGWILIGRSVLGATGDMGWNVERGDISDNTNPYSLGSKFQNLNFTEIMAATYSSEKNIDRAIKATVTTEFLEPGNEGTPLPWESGSVAPRFPTQNCEILLGTPSTTCFLNQVGYIAYTGDIILNSNAYTDSRWRFSGLDAQRFNTAQTSRLYYMGDFGFEAGMVFVR